MRKLIIKITFSSASVDSLHFKPVVAHSSESTDSLDVNPALEEKSG